MNSPLTENSRPEKALWYQEVLSLDPASRIFLPYARLLVENGRVAGVYMSGPGGARVLERARYVVAAPGRGGAAWLSQMAR